MSNSTLGIHHIVSGGQTGADRAALDWAIAVGIPYSGWCPKGRRAEDGSIPARYELMETASEDYAVRTEWNIRDSDATVILSCTEEISGGTALTKKLACESGKPLLHVHADQGIKIAAAQLQRFIEHNGVKVLNIAGPRGSKEPEVGQVVTEILTACFQEG